MRLSARHALFACSALIALVAFPKHASAGDPARVWLTIETRHFIINYHAEEEHLAQRLAIVAESAHDKLVPYLDHEPKHKTQVALVDSTDDSNGSATVLPYPTVNLYATAPDDRSELNDYDDWLSALITHEYTHIVHLDTIHSIARVINAILGFGEWGQLYSPNQSQPRFIIEGLAVFEETERTSAGRLRSTIYDMWLRAATLEGKFERLDQFTNYPIQWPRGSSAYLYGSAFMRYIASLYGPDIFRKLSHEYGGAWVPGSMNRALRRVTGGKRNGQTFETLYDGYRKSMVDRYKEQFARIEATGRREGNVLTGYSEYAARPFFTRDGKSIVWSDSNSYDRPRYRIIPKDGGKSQTLYKVDGSSGATFSLDGQTLYFSAEEVYRSQYYYYDLFAYDMKTGEKRQLTNGLRAENPDLSPDGKWLAFDVNDTSSRSLCLMSPEGGPLTWLIGNRDDLSQIYTPSWSPDGKSIVFSWWRDGGYRDIWTVDVATRETTRITADRALDLDPRYSPDGKYIYFTSDRTGIYNLYAYDLATHKTFQITNLVGGAFDIGVSPDGKSAAFIGFQADGWNLQTIALDPDKWTPAPDALMDRPDADEPKGLANLISHPYQAWRTAWPRQFTPSSYPDAFGQVLGISVTGSDILGLHSWSLGLGFSLARADDVTISASYSYNRFFPSFSLSAYRQLTVRSGFYIDGVNHNYVEDDFSATAGVSLPILRRIDRSADLTFDYNLAYLQNTQRNQLPLDPSLITPRLPEVGRVASLGVGWDYSNVHRYTFSVSPEEGRSMAINLGLSLKTLGSDYDVFSASWRYTEYIPIPWKPEALRNHVLLLSYGGGLSGGDITRRGAYYLGGYALQVQDIVRSFFDFTRAGTASLRGYAYSSISGSEFHLLNAEYRFPIVWIQRGAGTFPFYLDRLHGAIFADYGNAFSNGWNSKTLPDFKLGTGAEIRLDLTFFYYFSATIQLGYAHGYMTGGLDQFYLLLNNPF